MRVLSNFVPLCSVGEEVVKELGRQASGSMNIVFLFSVLLLYSLWD